MRKAVLFFCVVSATAVVASAQTPSDLETTIINALRGSSEASAQLDPAVHALLNQLTDEQRADLVANQDFNAIILPNGDSLAFALATIGFGVFPSTVDGGGGRSQGDDFTVKGTAGQPDAGDSAGGDYSLVGGYWPFFADDSIFSDGFESGNTSAWTLAEGEE